MRLLARRGPFAAFQLNGDVRDAESIVEFFRDLGEKLIVVLAVGALMIASRDAEAQARGTLQATATVVDTRQGVEALSAVRQSLTDSRIQSTSTVTTVAQISTARPATKPSAIVVTVDYSRN